MPTVPVMTEAERFYRIGGGSIDNLRLKPREAELDPPGISVLKASSANDAARQIREAFPAAKELHAAARTVGESDANKIRAAGFDIIPNATRKLPNHYRLIHPDGVAGFNEANLKRLSEAFSNSSGL